MSVLIIAEAGVNHNGDTTIAQKLIECAAKAGADIVKFQTFIPEMLVAKGAAKADYQKQTTDGEESQLDMLRKLVLPVDTYPLLLETCKVNKIGFLSTPFDMQSIDLLNGFDLPFWKIPSGEVTNLPYLIRIAQTGKQIFMSTGMCEIHEVRTAMNVLKENGAGEVIVLHCTTEYPAPITEVNLNVLDTLRRELGVSVGYSDHTPGIEIPIAAAAMGAVVIEKHFTLDKNMEGPDHKASLEPLELASMVRAIRNVEKAMGTGEKVPSVSERKNIVIARKSIVAKKDIKKGETLTDENITTKRPGSGISPMRWFEVIGTSAIRNFNSDELIEVD